MAKVEGLERLVERLRARVAASVKDDSKSVVVGYTAAYAIYVHENMDPSEGIPRRKPSKGHYWDVGQPKFLEQPAREFAREMGDIVMRAVAAGKTVLQGCLLAGLRLQRESMKLCPVDTGALRASAFTAIEDKP